ncbi:MAG: hypothetical protein NTW80_10120 [Deltaproteobacteria bacterium]|nr:hypothetical protein [Deltaproteobacteria bacterium]
MGHPISLTVLVTGIPPFVHGPRLLPGETKLQFLVRHHRQEWQNFISRMKSEFGISESICRKLRSVETAGIDDPVIISQTEQWANHRLPGHGRTLTDLAEMHQALQNQLFNLISSFELTQILWPREKHPLGDTSAEKMAASMGAEVISLDTGIKREMNLAEFLPRAKGDFLWLVPGGSRIFHPIVILSLQRILCHLKANPSVAIYHDGSYSVIYQVAALKLIASKYTFIPANVQEVAYLLQREHYSFCGDSGSKNPLCEIEEIYGGNYPFPKPARAGIASWWRRVFKR